jgi:hypothetical protein
MMFRVCLTNYLRLPRKKAFCSRRDHFGAFAAPPAKFEELVAGSSNRLQILTPLGRQTLYPKMRNVARKTPFYKFAAIDRLVKSSS